MTCNEKIFFFDIKENILKESISCLQKIHTFCDLTDLSKWHQKYNCDDFEIAPYYATNALCNCSAVILRSFDDTTVESGISQAVCLSAPGTYVFFVNICIQENGIQSGVHSVTPGIYSRICTPDRILAKSHLFTQADPNIRICLPFTVKEDGTFVIEICINGRGSAIIYNAQLFYAKITNSLLKLNYPSGD